MSLYTIPPSHPFLEVIAQRLLKETAHDPLSLSRYHVYMPTRRSRIKLAETLVAHQPKTVLPKLMSLTNLDVEALAFSHPKIMKEVLSLPNVLTASRRRFLLLTLIETFFQKRGDQRNSLYAVESLETLLDELLDERIAVAALQTLETGFESHQVETSVDFLKLFSKLWPALLSEEGAVSPQDHRRYLLNLQVESWRLAPPTHPVWLVGATGSLPDIRDFMAGVNQLETGSVFLPGYDPEMPSDVSVHHPLYSQQQFLEENEVAPDAVQCIGGDFSEVDRFLFDLFQPTSSQGQGAEAVFKGVSYLTAGRLEEEALCISLAIREFLEEKTGQALIITQSRILAKAIRAQLTEWGIEMDDSASIPVKETVLGTFIQETAKVLSSSTCDWVALLALLKHPFCWSGADRGGYLKQVRAFEKLFLRVAELPQSWQKNQQEVAAFFEKQVDPSFSKEFQDFLRVLLAYPEKYQTLKTLAPALEWHQVLLETCLQGSVNRHEGLEAAWTELKESLSADLPLKKVDYLQALTAVLSSLRTQAQQSSYTPRVQILGVMESRLMRADFLIFGGLNEGVWPAKKAEDPWLNRAMRKQLGLPRAEMHLGFSAHDFMNLLAHKDVLLTRAARQEGTLMRPSLFWRIVHLAAHKNSISLKERTHLLSWAQEKWQPSEGIQIPEAPKGRPHVNALPTKLSISNVTLLFNNPYAFYAKCILGLVPLRALGEFREEVQFGLMMHWILNQILFLKKPESEKIEALIQRGLARYMFQSVAWPFWKKRAERIVTWVQTQMAQDTDVEKRVGELAGTLTLPSPVGPLTLKGVADRMDVKKEGVAILDYKTGQAPSQKAVRAHQSPQLSLEAALFYEGSFQTLKPGGEVTSLAYWKLSGKEKAGEITQIKDCPERLAEGALRRLQDCIHQYYDEGHPFEATPVSVDPFYDHLMRLKHWTGGGA